MRRHGLPAINDPMTMNEAASGEWGLPSVPAVDGGAELAPELYDYSAGMFVGIPAQEADALAADQHPELIRLRTDLDIHSYEAPHEATHRKYEPPFTVPINQLAAGFTLIAPAINGLHYIKILACYLTLDAAGTLRFVQGDAFGNVNVPMTGNMNLGGAAVAPFQLPMAEIANPWHFTSPDQSLGIFTVTGKAQGWVVCCNSPYDA